MDDPRLAGFVTRLDGVNALAEASPGFVWRLQTEAGDATSIAVFEDPSLIINMSTWRSVQELKDFVFTGFHAEVMRRRREWFEHFRDAYTVAWWVPAGYRPSVQDAEDRYPAGDRRFDPDVGAHGGEAGVALLGPTPAWTDPCCPDRFRPGRNQAAL